MLEPAITYFADKMNVEKIRSDFPVLSRHISGKSIVYMDSACMSLKPMQVIDAVNDYMRNYPACAGRSVHKLGREATQNYEDARKRIANFINAESDEIVFTKNTTEGINFVAHVIGLKPGEHVVTTDREHNSNLVPWQVLGKNGVIHDIVKSKPDETFDLGVLQNSITSHTRLVSLVHVSNIDGYEVPVREASKIAKDSGALVLIDGAQSVPHREIDVKRLGCDFLSFSGHKMLGPSIGVLYISRSVQEEIGTFMTGGETVEFTTYTDHKFLRSPHKFEAGLQNYAGAIGLAAACEYLSKIGMKNVERHEKEITEKMFDFMSEIRGIEVVGRRSSGMISFNVRNMGFHDVAIMMDEDDNVMIRSGAHCAHSWFAARGLKGCARASIYIYNNDDDVHRFEACLKRVCSVV